jgi:AraC-like DNA-binding protein
MSANSRKNGAVVPGADSAGMPPFFSSQVTEARRFFLELNPRAPEPIFAVCGGLEYCAPDYHMQRKDFPYLSLEFVARGQGIVELLGQQHRLSAGVIFAYGPTVQHVISSDPARPLVKYFVDFQGKEAARLLALSIPSSRQVIQTSAPEQILRLFEDLIETGMRWSPFQKRICAVILEQLLLRVSETAVPFGSIGSEAFETYQRCRRYIETHYRTAAGLPDIAQDCNVDPAYLCRLFKRFDYQSPWQYVIQLKMRYAAQQLQMPQALIKRVAQELGFSDAFQFSHTFRRVYGISPRQFIQLQRTSSD